MSKDDSLRDLIERVDHKSLLADIMALDKALDDFMGDLRMRASWDKNNVDEDGTIALPCGNGVLYRLGEARNKLGNHLPALASIRAHMGTGG